jgi:hypothetical protein
MEAEAAEMEAQNQGVLQTIEEVAAEVLVGILMQVE